MYQVNRSIVILKPKEPFLNWVLQSDGFKQLQITLEDLRSDCTVLLLPNFNDQENALQYVYSQFKNIFEMELEAWFVDETLWPSNRTLKMFKEWIDVEFHSTVIDLVEDEFETSDLANSSLH